MRHFEPRSSGECQYRFQRESNMKISNFNLLPAIVWPLHWTRHVQRFHLSTFQAGSWFRRLYIADSCKKVLTHERTGQRVQMPTKRSSLSFKLFDSCGSFVTWHIFSARIRDKQTLGPRTKPKKLECESANWYYWYVNLTNKPTEEALVSFPSLLWFILILSSKNEFLKNGGGRLVLDSCLDLWRESLCFENAEDKVE